MEPHSSTLMRNFLRANNYVVFLGAMKALSQSVAPGTQTFIFRVPRGYRGSQPCATIVALTQRLGLFEFIFTRSGVVNVLQLDEGGELCAVFLLGVVGPELADRVPIAGQNTCFFIIDINHALKNPINLALMREGYKNIE